MKRWARKWAPECRGHELRKSLLLLLGGLAFFLGLASEAKAFSFGDIHVRSGFGERFQAEIELNVEGDDVEVALGDAEDYKRLDLTRQLIMNDLLIKEPLESRGGRKILHVISLKPLFFPSFNLVMRATQYGGTILKMYLITVDFRQSLALNVQGGKKKTSQATEPVDLLKEEVGPSGNRDEKVTEKMAGSDDAAEDVAPGMTFAPASLARPPTATIPSDTFNRMHSGAIWAAPRAARGLRVTPLPVSPDEEPPEVAAVPLTPDSDSQEKDDRETVSPAPGDSADAETNQGSSDSNRDSETSQATLENETADSPSAAEADGEPDENTSEGADESAEGSKKTGDSLKEGESLFDFAKRIAPSDADAAKVTVALWMDNQSKFINGNMNWIREGTRLNLGNLENRLDDLDRHQSNKILWSQWQEWKLIREKRLSPVIAEANEMIEEEPLPSEIVLDKYKIFEAFQGWKKSWENGNFGDHMAYYSQPPENDDNHSFSELKSRKKGCSIAIET